MASPATRHPRRSAAATTVRPRTVLHAAALMLVGCLSAGRSVAEPATGQQAADGAAPVVLKVVEDETAPAVVWGGKNIRDLHQEYRNIFRKGNRNAASHLWSAFLLERAGGMTAAKLEEMFTGFCAVSGSPTRPSEHTRYLMTLDMVTGVEISGYTYYCCWPCVCDTEDFIKVDTKTIGTAEGDREYHFLVIGNPCASPDRIPIQAPEVTCTADGVLEGAVMSDHGFVILTMFPTVDTAPSTADGAVALAHGSTTLPAQRQADFAPHCQRRKDNGYDSGMGDIFREVAGISPIQTRNQQGLPCPADSCPIPTGTEM